MTGSAFAYGALGFLVGFVNLLTLGLFIPKADQLLLRYQMNNVWFGDTKGLFIGRADSILNTHIITWLLAIPTLGLSRIWYGAAVVRFQFNHFSVGGVSFRADPSGGELFLLILGNFFIVLFTLGFGAPIVVQRNMYFLARHVSLRGDIEKATADIFQSQERLATSGEGLDGALGLDSGLF